MTDQQPAAGADLSSTDTFVPKGTLPGTGVATVIVALGQLFEDESWRRAFAYGGPALAGLLSTAWGWFAGPLERRQYFRAGLRVIDKRLKDPGTTDEEKKTLREQRQKLLDAYLGWIHRKLGGSNGAGKH